MSVEIVKVATSVCRTLLSDSASYCRKHREKALKMSTVIGSGKNPQNRT